MTTSPVTTTTTWTIDIPTEPTANIVLIKNISLETKEATIKDFFSFCGIIKAFEMKKDEQQHQVAIVYFEKESAAKTATLLSQAVVDNSPIGVEPYYKGQQQQEPINKGEQQTKGQQQQSVSHVMAQLLASGYVLTESVINKGAEFDEKHGVSTKVNGYLNKVGINLSNLNTRFVHSNASKNSGDVGGDETTATTTDDNSNVQARSSSTSSSTTQQHSRMQNLMKSRAGLKVQGIASSVANKVSNVHEEAKRIAAEKKNTTSVTTATITPEAAAMEEQDKANYNSNK